jgi:aspartyl-tRNA synthetase
MMEKLFALVDVRVAWPFPRLSYDEAMEKYGSDKPHTGFGLEWKRVSLAPGDAEKVRVAQPVKALRVPAWADVSRSQLDKLQDAAKSLGADWFSYVKLDGPVPQSPLAKALSEPSVAALAAAVDAQPRDLVLLVGIKSAASRDAFRMLDNASGELRLEIARKLDLLKPGTWNFLWVVDFPMFDYDEKAQRFVAMHHPFTSPREEDLKKLETDPRTVKARAYDLVLNGSEIGGGSIRIHRQDIQRRVFKVLGLSEEQARERFGFFLEALEYGTPPHGGIALGWDRINALMVGESSIREVIAFPKTASAIDLMCDSPAGVEPEQLDELGLKIKTWLVCEVERKTGRWPSKQTGRCLVRATAAGFDIPNWNVILDQDRRCRLSAPSRGRE